MRATNIMGKKKYNYGKYFKCICNDDDDDNFGLKKNYHTSIHNNFKKKPKNIFFLVKFSNKI